jgi:hypothetical protein
VKRKPVDPVAELRAALDLLSRAEVERAWAVADAATKSLGSGNLALKAEVAAALLALILAEMGSTSKRSDLADVLPAVDGLATYVFTRLPIIVTELGKADAC